MKINLQLFGYTDFDQVRLNKEPAIVIANLAVTTSPVAVASVAAPTKAEFDAVVALVNELKSKYDLSVTLVNAHKTKLNAICKG